jgi:hypothetical protein
VGCHICNPIGDAKIYYENDFILKHFKFLGLKNHLTRCKNLKGRLSDYNKTYNFGTYYLEDDAYHTKDYENFYNTRILI